MPRTPRAVPSDGPRRKAYNGAGYGAGQRTRTIHTTTCRLNQRALTWGRLMLALVLLVEASGCSKDALRQHGIEVEEGRVKKRVFEF